MANEKIRIKSSLAMRAVVVSLCLLVAPLFLHSLFLYWSEYKDTLADVMENLELTAKGQKAILEERIAIQWQILDADVAANDPELPKFLEIFEMPMPSGLPNHFAVISLQKDALISGKRISIETAIAVSTPIDHVFDQLTDFEKASYPLSLAFVDKDGRAIVGAKQASSLSVQLPIEGSNFFLYLSIPKGAVERLHREWYVYHFFSLLFFVGAIGGLIVWMITRRISKPLEQLCVAMGKVGEGATHVRYIPDKMGFEINELGKQFNKTLEELLAASKEAEEQRIGRERLAEEFKIGHDIQASLLPLHLPEMGGLDIAGGFLPSREVGGDFYDIFPMQDGKLLIVIADTAGKGISACLYSLGLRSMLRALADGKMSLTQMVLRANDLFWQDAMHSGMFVTVWIGIYDRETNVLEYSTQGHPPAYLVRDEEISELWTPGIAMGAVGLDMIATKKERLQEGDLLFLYTDGVIEAHSIRQQLFGKERLQKFLLQTSTQLSEKIVEKLLSEIQNFSLGQPQHDDIALLAIQILKKKFE